MLCFLPFSIDRRIHRTWRFGVVLCGLGTLVWPLVRVTADDDGTDSSNVDGGQATKDNSIKVMNMFVSIYLLTMLSVDRYISIVRASFKHRARSNWRFKEMKVDRHTKVYGMKISCHKRYLKHLIFDNWDVNFLISWPSNFADRSIWFWSFDSISVDWTVQLKPIDRPLLTWPEILIFTQGFVNGHLDRPCS